MEKIIWIFDSNKKDLVEEQKLINSGGGLRAICMLSYEGVEHIVNRYIQSQIACELPSVIIIDYESEINQDYNTLELFKQYVEIAGVPIIFLVKNKTDSLEEECYSMGVDIVLSKPLNNTLVSTIKHVTWRYEMTKNYERILQKQTNELIAAKQIKKLNDQLTSRNELLYKIFGRYFSDEVVQYILHNPHGADIGGSKQNITILMADLRGFTATCDTLEADCVTNILNNYLKTMTEVIIKNNGTVIEFIGDGILSVFGAPIESGHPELDAVNCAVSMQNSMEMVNIYNIANGYPTIEMGIGIHKGEVFIGNMGSERMMSYNVIGKPVNVCSRIESYSVGGQILVSKETIESITDFITVKNTFDISAKGVVDPITVCNIVGIKGELECILQDECNDEFTFTSDKVYFELHLINEKTVAKEPCISILESFSSKRVKVKCSAKSNIEIFSNVLITIRDENQNIICDNIYAKVIEEKDDILTLHFTFKTSKLEELIEKKIHIKE